MTHDITHRAGARRAFLGRGDVAMADVQQTLQVLSVERHDEVVA